MKKFIIISLLFCAGYCNAQVSISLSMLIGKKWTFDDVSNCTKNNVCFTGYDIFNDDGSYSGGKISTDGNGKDGWRIIGVLLK